MGDDMHADNLTLELGVEVECQSKISLQANFVHPWKRKDRDRCVTWDSHTQWAT